ncbi:MAG: hypothetical protein QXU98_08525 [Candidatus Parvarchaeota archaeon]
MNNDKKDKFKNRAFLILNIAFALVLVYLIYVVVFGSGNNLIDYLEYQNYFAKLGHVSFFNVVYIPKLINLNILIPPSQFTNTFVIIGISFIILFSLIILVTFIRKHIFKKNLFIILVLMIILTSAYILEQDYYLYYSVYQFRVTPIFNNIPLSNQLNGTYITQLNGTFITSYPNQLNITYIKIPYNNTFLYISNFMLSYFPINQLKIPNDTTIPIVFYIETQNQIKTYGIYPNMPIIESLPKVTLNFTIIKKGTNVMFYFVNNKNYNTSESYPFNALGMATIGIIYNNTFYVILNK